MATSELTDADREFLLERLDRDHIEQVSANVREKLIAGLAVEACYQPGDGTWYALMFVPKGALVGGDGGGTKGQAPSRWFHGDVTIIYGQGATMVDTAVHQDPGYVASKLTDNRASALALTELLREVLADA